MAAQQTPLAEGKPGGTDAPEDAGQPLECASPPCLMHEVDPAYFGFDAHPGAEPRAGGVPLASGKGRPVDPDTQALPARTCEDEAKD